MRATRDLSFDEIILVDTEFRSPPGETPEPVCLVAHELWSVRRHRFWASELGSEPPFLTGSSTLVVAYYAVAELSFFLAMDWPMPANICDLYVEFRGAFNGRRPPAGFGLAGACTALGVAGLDMMEKDAMRDLILHRVDYTAGQREAILDYCASDVDALERLFRRMGPSLNYRYALLRGDYLRVVAAMERRGIPIDLELLEAMRIGRSQIVNSLISRADTLGLYDGTSFRTARLEEYLARSGAADAWPRTPTGRVSLSSETFDGMSRVLPELRPVARLRKDLDQLRLDDIEVGRDGRNRTMTSPFGTVTSRNQPGTTKYIFSAARWKRGLIRPEQGVNAHPC